MSKAMCMLKWTGKYLCMMLACVIGIVTAMLVAFCVSCYISDLLNIKDYVMYVVLAIYFGCASVIMAYLKCYTTHFDKKSVS